MNLVWILSFPGAWAHAKTTSRSSHWPEAVPCLQVPKESPVSRGPMRLSNCISLENVKDPTSRDHDVKAVSLDCHTHAYIHTLGTHTYAYTHTHMHAHTYTLYTHTHAYTHAHTHTRHTVHTFIHIYTYTYTIYSYTICTCLYTHEPCTIHVCTYINTQYTCAHTCTYTLSPCVRWPGCDFSCQLYQDFVHYPPNSLLWRRPP